MAGSWQRTGHRAQGGTMRGLLTTFLIGFAGLVALLVAFVLCSAVMWGLSWVADRRTSQLDLSTARLPRDLLFCQRCGTPAGVGTIACLACGSTRFDLGQPARLAHSPGGGPPD